MRTLESYFITDLIGCGVFIEDKKAELHKLAREVERLSPCHRDPEAYHEAKSEIAHRLRQLAFEAESGGKPCDKRMQKQDYSGIYRNK